MAGLDPESTLLLEEAIRSRLSQEERGSWSELMAEYPEISRSTFFRKVRKVQKALRLDAIPPEPIHAPAFTEQEVANDIGCGSCNLPSYMKALAYPRDLLRELAKMMADIELLRASSVKYVMAGDGMMKEKVVNAIVLERAMRQKLALLKQMVRLNDTCMSHQATAEYYDALTAEIVASDPDLQYRVMKRLHALKSRKVQAAAA